MIESCIVMKSPKTQKRKIEHRRVKWDPCIAKFEDYKIRNAQPEGSPSLPRASPRINLNELPRQLVKWINH